MQPFEKLQSRFPFITNWEQTKFTRKGHCVFKGSASTLVECFSPDTYGDDGNWETHEGLLVVTAIVDAKTNQTYAYWVKEW